MNKYITAAFAILILLIAGFAAGRWFVPTKVVRTVDVTGECIANVPKDRTEISLNITVLEPSAPASLTAGSARYAKLSEYLKGIKDDSLKLQTKRFDTNEKTKWNDGEKEYKFVGFETNIEVSVSSKDRSIIEKIIFDTAGMEDVRPGNLRMSVSTDKMQSALESCIRTAVENARDRAESIAAADGEKVARMTGARFSRTAGGGDDYRPRFMRADAVESIAAMGAAPELFASESEVSVAVTATFELK